MNEEIINIDHDYTILVEWFRDNFMSLNTSNCHLLVAGYSDELVWFSRRCCLRAIHKIIKNFNRLFTKV